MGSQVNIRSVAARERCRFRARMSRTASACRDGLPMPRFFIAGFFRAEIFSKIFHGVIFRAAF
jgi:hypothetical protein